MAPLLDVHRLHARAALRDYAGDGTRATADLLRLLDTLSTPVVPLPGAPPAPTARARPAA